MTDVLVTRIKGTISSKPSKVRAANKSKTVESGGGTPESAAEDGRSPQPNPPARADPHSTSPSLQGTMPLPPNPYAYALPGAGGAGMYHPYGQVPMWPPPPHAYGYVFFFASAPSNAYLLSPFRQYLTPSMIQGSSFFI